MRDVELENFLQDDHDGFCLNAGAVFLGRRLLIHFIFQITHQITLAITMHFRFICVDTKFAGDIILIDGILYKRREWLQQQQAG